MFGEDIIWLSNVTIMTLEKAFVSNIERFLTILYCALGMTNLKTCYSILEEQVGTCILLIIQKNSYQSYGKMVWRLRRDKAGSQRNQ